MDIEKFYNLSKTFILNYDKTGLLHVLNREFAKKSMYNFIQTSNGFKIIRKSKYFTTTPIENIPLTVYGFVTGDQAPIQLDINIELDESLNPRVTIIILFFVMIILLIIVLLKKGVDAIYYFVFSEICYYFFISIYRNASKNIIQNIKYMFDRNIIEER